MNSLTISRAISCWRTKCSSWAWPQQCIKMMSPCRCLSGNKALDAQGRQSFMACPASADIELHVTLPDKPNIAYAAPARASSWTPQEPRSRQQVSLQFARISLGASWMQRPGCNTTTYARSEMRTACSAAFKHMRVGHVTRVANSAQASHILPSRQWPKIRSDIAKRMLMYCKLLWCRGRRRSKTARHSNPFRSQH